MTEMNKKIIDLINQNISMKGIAAILNISEKQLYLRIKQIINYGYQLHPSYSYNSDIYYDITNIDSPLNSIKISLPKKESVFKCLVISDLHVGNYKSNLNLVNYVYDYASKKGINYIFICGDNIEGDYTCDKKNIKDIDSQIETLIKKYPYDKNIINVMIFGNHDHHALKSNGFNVASRIKNSRYDMVPIGYGQGNVNIRKDSFILFHKLHEQSSPNVLNNEKVVLSGHGHMMKTKIREQLWLCIPTLSYVSTDKTKDVIPGFVELNIDFERGKFESISAKHIIITPKLMVASESRCKLKSLTICDKSLN